MLLCKLEEAETWMVKMNFDGAWEEHGCVGGMGVVILDDTGTFVLAMALKLVGISSSLQARMEVVRTTVMFAWEVSASPVEFEVDAHLVLVALNLEAVDDTSLIGYVVNDSQYFLRTLHHIKLT